MYNSDNVIQLTERINIMQEERKMRADRVTERHGYKITMKRLLTGETFDVYHYGKDANEAMATANRHSFDSATIVEVVDQTTGERVYPQKASAGTIKFFKTAPSIPNDNRWKPQLYNYPPITDLLTPLSQDNYAEDEDRTRKIENLLSTFRVCAHVVHVTHGTAISRFELEIALGTRINKITKLENEISYVLGVNSVRIIAPIPGKSLIGIEIPNWNVETVALREVLTSPAMNKSTSILTLALGKDRIGQPVLYDLEKLPHILLSGQTGSGKSIFIHSVIQSLIYRTTPDDVKLILIDPRVVELQCYNGIPHLMLPVINNPYKVEAALIYAIELMKERSLLLYTKKANSISDYNSKRKSYEKPVPRIVIIIDNLNDIDDTTNVLQLLNQLASNGASVGIHLVLSTQHPSFNMTNSAMKYNIPCRIAFRSVSAKESQLILGQAGAELLTGSGSMLFLSKGDSEPKWVQGCFVSHEEVLKVTKHVRDSNPCTYDPDILERIEQIASNNYSKASTENDTEGESINYSELFDRAVQIAITDGQISTSTLQRRLKIGYARAGRIIDEMQKKGIISVEAAGKSHMCLIGKEVKAAGIPAASKSPVAQPTKEEPKQEISGVFSDWLDLLTR